MSTSYQSRMIQEIRGNESIWRMESQAWITLQSCPCHERQEESLLYQDYKVTSEMELISRRQVQEGGGITLWLKQIKVTVQVCFILAF